MTSINNSNNTETQLTTPDSVEILATNFNNFSRKSTESIVEMAKIVVKAKALPNSEYEQFCMQIRFKKDSKALIKLSKIGFKAELFMQHANILPSNWTTLYTLAQIEDPILEALIEEGKIYCSLTGVEAQKLVNVVNGKPESSIQNHAPTNADTATNTQTVLADNSYSMAIQFENTPSLDVVKELELLIKEFIQRRATHALVSMSQLLDSILHQSQPALGGV